MRARIEKWKQKSLFSKISDFIFIAFIVALLIPQSRLEIGGFINRIKAKAMQPDVVEAGSAQHLTAADYEWNLADVNGAPVQFSDYKGKVLFVNMWATWCPPCVGEMPEIQTLYDKFKDNPNVAFFMVSNETPAKIKEFVTKRKFTFPVFSMQSAPTSKFEYSGIPTTFIVGKDGAIVVSEVGASNWGGETTVKIIEDLINK